MTKPMSERCGIPFAVSDGMYYCALVVGHDGPHERSATLTSIVADVVGALDKGIPIQPTSYYHEQMREALDRAADEPISAPDIAVPMAMVHAICEAVSGTCVRTHDPERPPCRESNCAAVRAAIEFARHAVNRGA